MCGQQGHEREWLLWQLVTVAAAHGACVWGGRVWGGGAAPGSGLPVLGSLDSTHRCRRPAALMKETDGRSPGSWAAQGYHGGHGSGAGAALAPAGWKVVRWSRSPGREPCLLTATEAPAHQRPSGGVVVTSVVLGGSSLGWFLSAETSL